MAVVSEEVDGSVRSAVIAVGEHWSTAQRRLVRLVVELDESGEWARDDALTCSHWVAAALDVEVCTAREWLRIGRQLRELPAVDGAFERGELSYSKVRTITRVATPGTEAELCRIAIPVPAGRLAHALASWLTRHELPEETELRQRTARSLTWRTEPDGMVVASLRLEPLKGGALMSAVDAKVMSYRPDASADAWPSSAQQRADALVALVTGGGSSVTAEVVMHVRGDGCTLDDGTPVAESVIERIAPQAFLRVLIHDAERRPINASGRQRHPTVRQKRVVRERDQVCVDCGGNEFLEFDHDPPYEETHLTTVEGGKLRCRGCHRERHRRLRVSSAE